MSLILTLMGCIGEYAPSDEVPLVPADHPCAGVSPGPWSGHPLLDVELTTIAPTRAAGIAELFVQMPPLGESRTVDIPITDAVVSNLGFDGNTGDPPLWITDQAGGVRTFDVPGLSAYRPGDGISMRVTELTNYFGELEITGLTQDDRSSTNNPVYRFRADKETLSFPADRAINAEFAGLIVGESPDDCGDNPCLEIDNGVVVQTVDLRGPYPQNLVYGETCMHTLSPVEFTRGSVRLGGSSFDWLQTY